jgi:mevalonate pyrophosphate decarboxylase
MSNDKNNYTSNAYIIWTTNHDEMLQNVMQINQGVSFKSIAENFENNNLNPMFNIEKSVRHMRYMKLKH